VALAAGPNDEEEDLYTPWSHTGVEV